MRFFLVRGILYLDWADLALDFARKLCFFLLNESIQKAYSK